MARRVKRRMWSFGAAIGLLLAASWTHAAATRGSAPNTIEVSSLEELSRAVETATPGAVIHLAPGTYSLLADEPPLRLKGLRGRPDQPIVIRGTQAAGSRPAIIDGGRRLDGTLGLIEQFGPSGGRSPDLEELITQNQYRTRRAVNCLIVEDSAYVVIEELTIRNCWPTAVVFLSSDHVTLRANTIVGSTYPFFIDRRSDHFVVEDSVWTQDDSGYAPDESGYSGRYDPRAKPGRMWDTVPWGVLHHGSRAYFNGGLIGSFGTRGDIVIRRNIVRNAYNGVRLRANRCLHPQCNANVEIYDNDFHFIRDNVVEPEDQAVNWWIFHNRIHNAHAWFSFDGIGGGPVYVFGNLGWFDDKPSRQCVPAEWAADRTLQVDGYAPTADNECSRSRTGKVIKLGPGKISLNEPVYVFNNSWYVRAPLVEGGSSKFRAWNNATLFCDPDVAAPGMCVADYVTEAHCVQSVPESNDAVPNRFPVGLDRVPFIDCFSTGPGDEASSGISNHPDFPDALAALGYPVHGVHGDPGFVNAAIGDFHLRPDSLARGKACTVMRVADGSLKCTSSDAAVKRDIGAYQDNVLVEGPDYSYRGDEQPRVMKATWRTGTSSVVLEMVFSEPMSDPSSARIAVRLGDGETVKSEPCRKVRAMALECRFPKLRALPDATATTLLPPSLTSTTGRPVTPWAAGTRVDFQR